MPLEKQKTAIIDTIDKMHSNMREYTMDIEEQLDKAYAAIGGGVAKKFGFENVSGVKNLIVNEGGEREYLPAKKIDREIEKMSHHATQFLSKLPPSGQSRPPSGIKSIANESSSSQSTQ